MPLLIPSPLAVDSRPSVVFTFTSTAPPEFISVAFPEAGVTSTLNSVPFKVSPEPAVNVPVPENCVNVSAVDPKVIGLSVVKTQPVFPYKVPSSTNVKNPAVTSELTFASSALTAAPED